jgi:alkylation response protein AidB-like acyl-CoA dehydrogenase
MRAEPFACPELEAARDITPRLAAGAREFEIARKVDRALMQEMFDAGMVQMAVPSVYGGRESRLEETLLVIEAVARGDASAAWCLMNYQTTAFVAGLMQPDAARAVFGAAEHAVPAGVLAPTARARFIDGGLVANGRWAFASGCDHANWLLGTVVIEDDAGQPMTQTDGAPRVVLPLFSRDQFTIIDTWQVSGLCASGSHDVEVVDAVVPAGRWLTLADPLVVDTPLYRFPLLSTFPPCVAMVSLGAARAALDYFVELARTKTPAGGTMPLRERASAQIDAARAEAMIDAARAYVLETVGALWEEVERGVPASVDARRRVRLAGTYAARVAAEAVTLLYDAGGASSIALDCPLQRHLRDVRTVTQHLQVSSAGFERVGRLRLTDTVVGPL